MEMGVNMTNDNFLKGQCLSDGNPYINTIPRKWTDSEIEYMLKLKSSGKTIKEICTILERSEASVSVKLKRLKKKDGNYNEKHLTEKVGINKQFVEYIKPNSILDVYARDGNVAYTNYNVISNDIDSSCETTYHMDAFDLLCTLYLDKEKFDIIDLDPYGSAYDCFDFAIKMANKGLCITLGEMGHKRWKRLDYVKLRYGIYELKDFTSDNLIKKIQEIGLRNKKKLNVFAVKDWQNISRVWFTIEPYKETSQWENKKEDNLDKWVDF